MKKRYITTLYCLLAFVFICGFLCCIGSYPLLDVDETRYVNMARDMFNTKDYLTLFLNGDYFFEKPPLFFWIECISFKLTGVISELTARLPIILLSLLPVGLLFFLCKKIKGERFAIISVMVLLTSLEYVILTKIAMLDSVLASFAVSSVLCYFYTFYVEEKHKKYFWILTYVFSALAVLAKGIPGAAIPAFVIAVSTVVFKTYKETLKYSWGFLIFLLITLPWHLVMLKIYGSLFFDEYIMKHHILRFLGSDVIHRSQPWYFYILTLLWGLFPHVFVLLGKFKYINLKDKFLTLNFIAAISILVFFSLSKAKLITYILPIYPFLAVLIGAIWIKMHKLKLFLSVVISMSLLSGFLSPYIYKFNYSFGQDDLMKFANFAKENNYTISTYMTGRKYSLLYYGNQSKIEFHNEEDLNWLKEELKKENHIVITRNKEIENLPIKVKEKGVKYSIIERFDNEKQ
ncbi:glycosyltransferase family 39 protein [bacterium]|nr:glycosyltransferase family 39 protein [bacterium]